MRCFGMSILVLCVSVALADHPPAKEKQPAVLWEGLGNGHHPVSTKNAEAQKFFNQGLTLIHGFNHEEAVRMFERAAELDPELAMAHWGIGYAMGPNYNIDADEPGHKSAYESTQKALKLSEKASDPEKAYIQALAKRYSNDAKADRKQLATDYAKAMKELAKAYPDDLDAATLYAESLMNLRPWELWSADGKPAEGTEEIVTTLESVLKRNPNHPGANHLYIHAVEASPTPERGLPAADRLRTLVPAAGHLVHMPSHIYMRVGDYESAARVNELAIEADEAMIKRGLGKGVYSMMYYSHNIHFLAVARATQGRYGDALKAAEKLVKHVGPHVCEMPMLEGFMPTTTFVMIRFQKWDAILDSKGPDVNMKTTKAIWHFSRGLAYLAKGKTEEAEKERTAFRAARKAITEDTPYSDRNKAQAVMAVAEPYLDARFAVAAKDNKKAVELLEQAIRAEDALNYMEPSDWYVPVREALGGVRFQSGEFAEAEKTFRADLEINRRNGRSLFGLRECLKAQKQDYAAQLVDQEFKAAWKHAEKPELRLEDY